MKLYISIEVPEGFEIGCCVDCPLSTYDSDLDMHICQLGYAHNECPLEADLEEE